MQKSKGRGGSKVKGCKGLEERRRMRKSNRGMRFDLLWSLIHPSLTPGVSHPVHDKGAQARLSREAGNKRRCEKAGFEPSRARSEAEAESTRLYER